MNKEEKSPQGKQNKLIEKCKNLADKIENEKSTIKRMFYSIKLDMLLAKLQREIDIRELQEKYQVDRKTKVQEKDQKKTNARTEIIKKTEEINELKKFLEKNKQYDYDSESFLFDKEDVVNEGGINPYIGVLNNSGVKSQEEAAKKMQEVYKARQKLEDLENQVEEKNGELRDSEKNIKKEEIKSKVTETAMVAVKKGNIFQRIGRFFKSFKENFKKAREEYKDIKAIKNDKIKRERLANNMYWNERNEIEQNYNEQREKLEEQLEKLKEDYKENIQFIDGIHQGMDKKRDNEFKGKIDSKRNEKGKEQANAFKSQIADMGNYSADTGTNSNKPKVSEHTVDENKKGREIVD